MIAFNGFLFYLFICLFVLFFLLLLLNFFMYQTWSAFIYLFIFAKLGLKSSLDLLIIDIN